MSHFVEGITEKDRQKFRSKGKRILEEDAAKLVKPYVFTGSASLGQVFALSQDWALNWEIKWFYTIIQYVKSSGEKGSETPVNIGFSIGANYYFPGASYR